jgi:GNAT superfamily N-acetyltransferase
VNASNSPLVCLSAIDQERFGILVAKTSQITLNTLVEINTFCEQNSVAMLIARCPVTDLALVHELGRTGFELMDTLVYYARDLNEIPGELLRENLQIRPVRPAEADIVRELAAEVFRGYQGHYQADKRLDRKQCDQVYESWAYRSCILREVADEVLVADLAGTLQGFITLKKNNHAEGECGLIGVGPTARGLGIAQALMSRALAWCRGQGLQKMLISTQIHNIASQRVWIRLGFKPSHAFYTLHKWYEDIADCRLQIAD